MTHVRDLIHSSLEYALAPDDQTRLDAHLAACDGCRRLWTELQRNDAVLAARAALPTVPRRRMPRRDRFGLVRPGLVSVATLALALVAGTQLAAWRVGNGPASPPTAAVDVVGRSEVGSPPDAPYQLLPRLGEPGAPQCGAAGIPVLDVAHPAPPGDQPGTGATGAEAAFRSRYPGIDNFTMYAWGSAQPARSASDLGRGPVWIVAGSDTYVAMALGLAEGKNWFVYPARFTGCRTPPPETVRTWLAQRSLDVDGYRLTVKVVADAAYGPSSPVAAWAVSAVAGFGLSCEWTRTGPDVGKIELLEGTPTSIVSTATYDNVLSGARGGRINGVPAEALRGTVATTFCGVRDAAGQHGVIADLAIATDGNYADSSLRLSPWSTSPVPTTPSTQEGPAPLAEPRIASWATGHVSTGEIVEILQAAGIGATISPPAPAKALLFNAMDLDLIAAELPGVRGFAVYRYSDVSAARRAFDLPLITQPYSGTIDWIARPHFVLVGDAIVGFATDDQTVAARIFDALTLPRVSFTATVADVGPTVAVGFHRLRLVVSGTPEGRAAGFAGRTLDIMAVPATVYYLTAGTEGREVDHNAMLAVLRSGAIFAVTILEVPGSDGIYTLMRISNITR